MKSLIFSAMLMLATLFLACNEDNTDAQSEHQSLMVTALTKEITKDVVIEYNTEANTIVLNFPQEKPVPAGSVTISDSSKNHKSHVFELKTNPMKRMYIRVDNFEKGVWIVKVARQGEDKIYETEEKFNIIPNNWSRPIH